MFKIAVICGGPSRERGISLNSARSVLDHLSSDEIEIVPIYVDCQRRFYVISQAQLYSNTPADFDFKLAQTAKALGQEEMAQLFEQIDLVFPLIHGSFGEDGQLQAILEGLGARFIGPDSKSCQEMFCKYSAANRLKKEGFATLPSLLLSPDHICLSEIKAFFQAHNLKRAIVKPAIGGSSIGVCSVADPQQALEKALYLFDQGLAQRALLEPFCEGREFTVVLFEDLSGQPVALVPTEIEVSYDNHQIFDYRKKYLPTNQAAYHTPARFEEAVLQKIRRRAESLFRLFQMRDFARLDGWVMPDGSLYFTDINPISGLEQNSFFFRQASMLGMTHRQALYHIVHCASRRFGLPLPPLGEENKADLSPVYVLFGSRNAERQVSLMSGTNVWLKLLRSSAYAPTPFLFDKQGFVWELPYAYTLDHTVEEIYANCLAAERGSLKMPSFLGEVQQRLGLESSSLPLPMRLSLEAFLRRANENQAFAFIAMHGGEGENGTLQRQFDRYHLPYNGSDAKASALCMDKYLTGEAIRQLADPDILSIPKKSLSVSSLSKETLDGQWEQLVEELGSSSLIIKPRCDGCSAGIVLLQSAQDLAYYIHVIQQGLSFIPAHSFANQKEVIEMPSALDGDFIIEPYIETDAIYLSQHSLQHKAKQGWIELTVGVLEQNGLYHALNPSITLAEGAVLSLEEKFQGGTGVNLTPPPEELISFEATDKIKRLVEKAAQALGIQNYARLDIFFNRLTEKIILIEANTLPGLTPSTVIYHQGLAEEPPLSPLALLEKIIFSKLNKQHPLTEFLNRQNSLNLR
ncbi:D-alanine--D-alanine ligase family protein [Candidatus Protochlamydia phocaeensis]|uniref:D-alanine--D-alanine ligase family protein n=1 Tax=Candidatus Protochlamydia phocaeensis TaxID=1414722 RepID=UPI000837BE31|nr:hypothetical protein [Candidatus Protochlamydia phocaeensis]